jgi:PAS domain S-box-containing protein
MRSLEALKRAGATRGWALAGLAGIENGLLWTLAATALVVAVLAALPLGVSANAARATILPIAAGASSLVLIVRCFRAKTSNALRALAAGLSVAVIFQVGALLVRAVEGRPLFDPDVATASIALVLTAFLGALSLKFFDQIRERRAELLSDIAMVAILAGAAVYLLLHIQTTSRDTLGVLGVALISICAVLVVAGGGVLTLWSPSRAHLGQFLCSCVIGAAALSQTGQIGRPAGSPIGLHAAVAFALLAATSLWVMDSRSNPAAGPMARWWIRPSLLALSFVTTAALFVVAVSNRKLHVATPETLAVGLTVLGAIAARAMMAQLSMVRTARALETALGERESAMESLKAAAQGVSASEARLQLLLESAVDGIVELDSDRRIVRANDAFCATVHLPAAQIVGRTWAEMVAMAGPGWEDLLDLPDSGEATISRAGTASFLEARSSGLPTTPPGSLLLIRDVTSSRVAEQTIRSLFQFLQDRDEDRTSLLKRTNSAIEAERNRIARDLHDGPIQGISAASLSLEAVRMAMGRGLVERAATLLGTVSAELSEEAMNLRRVMKDLRPPLLEQRGLIAAVQELCDRANRELEIPVVLTGRVGTAIPNDIETLAYRVVQEALSNVAKHAQAGRVSVRIEASAGTLQVDVSDDGRGFNAGAAREFLKEGKVGLASMRERAELAGGTLTVKSTEGEGTSVLAVLPFEVLATATPAAG